MSDQKNTPEVPDSELAVAPADIQEKDPTTTEENPSADPDQALLDSAESGDLPEVTRLIEKGGAKVIARNSGGETALHLAARHDHPEIVEELLAHNAEVNAQDDDNWTPVFGAAQGGKDKVIQSLINKARSKVDFSLRANSGRTPLYAASYWGYNDTVKIILEQGGISTIDLTEEDGWTPLHSASSDGYTNLVELLLQKKASIDILSSDGQTPLHIACSRDEYDVVKLLLQYDPDKRVINCQDSDGQTALHLASATGDDESKIVALLLSQNPKIDLLNSEKQTVLHVACSQGRYDVVKLLLARDLELRTLNLQDSEGQTALHLASAAFDKSKIVQLLLNHKAKIDLLNLKKETALHVACTQDRYDAATLLLEQDQDNESEDNRLIDNQDIDGQTALHLASTNYDSKMAKLLLDHKAKLSLLNSERQTALHLACDLGRYKVVELLLSSDPDVDSEDTPMIDIQDCHGKTALHVAVIGHESEIVKLLLSHTPNTDLTDDGEETALQLAAREKEPGYVETFTAIAEKTRESLRKTALVLAAGRPDTDWNEIKKRLDSLEWTNLEKNGVNDEVLWVWKAANDKNQDELKQLLKKKALSDSEWETSDWTDYETWQALHWATYLGNYVIVWWLLIRSPSSGEAAKWQKEALDLAQKRRTDLRKEREKDKDRENMTWVQAQQPGSIRSLEISETGNDREISTSAQVKDLAFIGDWKMDTKNPLKITFDRKKIKETQKETQKENKIDTEKGLAIPIAKDTPIAGNDEANEKNQKGSDHDERDEEFRLTIDMLKDPPVQQGLQKLPYPDDPYEPLPWKERTRIEADATIMDFFKMHEDVAFLRRSRDVAEIIYNDGPKEIMKNAKETLRKISSEAAKEKAYWKLDPFMRWIHLPSNNMDWMTDLSKRLYLDNDRSPSEYRELSEFLRHSWQELPESASHAHSMRPTCIREQNTWLPEPIPPESPMREEVTTADQTSPESMEKDETMKNPKSEAKDKPAKDEDRKYWRTALYMPYLTFANLPMNEINKNHTTDVPMEFDQLTDELSECNDASVDAFIKSDQPINKKNESEIKSSPNKPNRHIEHGSQTLDQFYYRSMSYTKDRDENQVVLRYQKEKSTKILRVDHLWLWVIDPKTIITSSTKRIDGEDDPVLEGIFDSLRKAKGKRNAKPPSSVEELSKFITSFCVDFIDQFTIPIDSAPYSACQIFALTINKAGETDADLYKSFKVKIQAKLDALKKPKDKKTKKRANSPLVSSGEDNRQHHHEGGEKEVANRAKETRLDDVNESINHEDNEEETANGSDEISDNSEQANHKTIKQEATNASKKATPEESDYFAISKATSLLVDVKHTRGELNILKFLLGQQNIVWEILSKQSPDGTSNDIPPVIDEGGKWKGPAYAIKLVDEMDKIAQSVQESVNSLLSLEQNEANISEAEESRKQTIVSVNQGKTVMVFTIITIIFLPLSFLEALFGLNISVFPHRDGSLAYAPEYIFPILFGVAVVVVSVTIFCGFYLPTIIDFDTPSLGSLQYLFKSNGTNNEKREEEPKYRGQNNNTIGMHLTTEKEDPTLQIQEIKKERQRFIEWYHKFRKAKDPPLQDSEV